jgi:hypothetical protein
VYIPLLGHAKVVTGQTLVPPSPLHIALAGASSLEAITAAAAQGAVVAAPGQTCSTGSPVQVPRAGVQPELQPTVTIAPAVQVRTPPAIVRLHVRGTPEHDGAPPSKPGHCDGRYCQAAPVQFPAVAPVELPGTQLLEVAHQPQPPRGVHAPQVVDVLHTTGGTSGRGPASKPAQSDGR